MRFKAELQISFHIKNCDVVKQALYMSIRIEISLEKRTLNILD